MFAGRKNARIKDNLPVRWRVEGQDISGCGTIVDLSAIGLQLITDKVLEIPKDSIFLIEMLAGDQVVASKKVKILWFKKSADKTREFIQCGGEFI